MSVFVQVLLGFFFLLCKGGSAEALCYFKQEFQGEYVMQKSNTGNNVQYTTVYINGTNFPIFGNCHKRNGNNYILSVNNGEASCIRCLHMKLRSANVLQVLATTFSNCHMNEEQAEKMCPSEDSLKHKNVTEIILFKTKNVNEVKPTNGRYCPLDQKYNLRYFSKNMRTLEKIECTGLDSTIDSCPSGSTLNVRLKGCNLENNDFKFECLGHWDGTKEESYVIFTDSRRYKPRYRCAVYQKQRGTDRIFMSLSNDSTCYTGLHNATAGVETFELIPKSIEWPDMNEKCTFPEWLQGNWEHIRVNGDTLIYQDHSSFKTYTIKCARFHERDNKYLVFSRTQCGEENYNCMWIHKRTENVLEFQIGFKTSHTNNIDLCEDVKFDDDSWVTQGRISTPTSPRIHPGMCPISPGEYTGVLPDAPDLCAKLWSDCEGDVMYYTVSSCLTGEIYEEREYVCLGHWKEDNLLYTYTQRMDVAADTYECFVGTISQNQEIFIKEAGSFCQRNIDPVKDGMQLFKKKSHSCPSIKMPITEVPKRSYEITTTARTTQKSTTKRTIYTVGYTKSTRKPWNFDNDINDIDTNVKSPNGACKIQSTPKFHCITAMNLFLLLVRFF